MGGSETSLELRPFPPGLGDPRRWTCTVSTSRSERPVVVRRFGGSVLRAFRCPFGVPPGTPMLGGLLVVHGRSPNSNLHHLGSRRIGEASHERRRWWLSYPTESGVPGACGGGDGMLPRIIYVAFYGSLE